MTGLDPFRERPRVAYISMEIAIKPEIHTYSGGLGILAGDVARSCADLELPMVLVTLVLMIVMERLTGISKRIR